MEKYLYRLADPVFFPHPERACFQRHGRFFQPAQSAGRSVDAARLHVEIDVKAAAGSQGLGQYFSDHLRFGHIPRG